jgi:uncharacterized protein involved in response to NO
MSAAVSAPLRPPVAWPVLALGFRPFYLAGALAALVLLPLWLAVFTGWLSLPLADPLAWHAHEMLFGFGAAIIAGFLLTAVRNWTGADTPRHLPLAGLVALWLAGRLAPFLLPGWPAALIDLAFLPVLAIALARPILAMQVRKASQRPWLPLVVLSLLTGANLLQHLGMLGGPEQLLGLGRTLGLGTVAILIAVIAARIVPSFTMSGAGIFVPAAPRRDRIALLVLILAVGLNVAATLLPLPAALLAFVNAAAALLHLARLQQWRSWQVLRVPLLAILHVAYLWLPVAFALRAAAALVDTVPPVLADHALAIGAMTGLMLGMMTRSSLGHTGRPLKAGAVEVAIYAAIMLAALLRLCAGLHAGWTLPLLATAGLAWEAAFGLFLLRYAPMLLRPRADGKPG